MYFEAATLAIVPVKVSPTTPNVVGPHMKAKMPAPACEKKWGAHLAFKKAFYTEV